LTTRKCFSALSKTVGFMKSCMKE